MLLSRNEDRGDRESNADRPGRGKNIDTLEMVELSGSSLTG